MNNTVLVTLPIEKIYPYHNNNKIHNERNIREIAKSIEEFGYLSYVGVDEEGSVLYGEGRYLALKSLGYTEIEVQQISYLTEAQKVAFRIVDNKLSDDSLYDYDAIQKEIEWLMTNSYESDLDMLSATLAKDTEEVVRTLEEVSKEYVETDSFIKAPSTETVKDVFQRRTFMKGDTVQLGGLTVILGEIECISNSCYIGRENRRDFKNAIYVAEGSFSSYDGVMDDFIVWHKGSVEDFSSKLVLNKSISLVLFKGENFLRKRYNNLVTCAPSSDSPSEPPVLFWDDVLGNFLPVGSTVCTTMINVGLASITKDISTLLYVENGTDINDLLFSAERGGMLKGVQVLLNGEEIDV